MITRPTCFLVLGFTKARPLEISGCTQANPNLDLKQIINEKKIGFTSRF